LHTHHFLADPRSIPLAERAAMAERLRRDQTTWLMRLNRLTELPLLEADFPAFLLATPPFSSLAVRIGEAGTRSELPPDVADELDWFVNAYRDYLRTCDGEDVFASRRG
jgi:hypothetical protein